MDASRHLLTLNSNKVAPFHPQVTIRKGSHHHRHHHRAKPHNHHLEAHRNTLLISSKEAHNHLLEAQRDTLLTSNQANRSLNTPLDTLHSGNPATQYLRAAISSRAHNPHQGRQHKTPLAGQ